ncbi:MAG: glycosyltransferase [Thermoclostridium sp.]|nr:glycosyltransferase [Thermoclostridium sp.]
MKKVLMIAHQFPPIGGSGVQRTVKFIKYLPEFGWKGSVFTRQAKKAQLTDSTLSSDIPQDTQVYRSAAWDLSEWPFPLNLAGKFIRRKILVPDGERLWGLFARRQAIHAARTGGYDMLYSTSQPFSTHLLAMEVKKELPSLPWVVDLRDEWTNNSFVRAYGYSPARIRQEKAMERQAFEMADAVVINTPFMRDNSVRDYPWLKDKFHVIPNGFDLEDFAGLEQGRKNDRFTLTYTGLIYGNTSPETVFKAVSGLIREGCIQPGEFRLRFIGRYKPDLLEGMAREHQLGQVIEVLPYMPHRESIQNLLWSDSVLLLLGEDTEAIYTGKLMEYINTGKPILASIPSKGAAASLIQETKTGFVAHCGDVTATAEHILSMVKNWRQGKALFQPDLSKVARYERKELTKNLAEVFNGLCERKPGK